MPCPIRTARPWMGWISALVVLDRQLNMMEYAGAYNPLVADQEW